MFSGFWVFWGCLILIAIFLHFILYLMELFVSNITIWFRGYPRKTVYDEIVRKAHLERVRQKEAE